MRRILGRLISIGVLLAVWGGVGAINVAAVSTSPILLVTSSTAPNPFGAYLGEILRAEGLNSFTPVDLSAVDSTTLTSAKVVVLAEMPLSPSQAQLFVNYVNGGGRLLALRPDADLAPALGLTAVGTSQTDGYLKIDGAQPAGAGLPTTTLQIHGASDRYTLAGATALATLYSNATTATSYPAVVTATVGSGRSAAFTYDLARNVVYTRQGNPANADVDVDGDGVKRTVDLFEGTGGTAWVDRDKIPVPQADVQQRLFARLVRQLTDDVMPLPQLWYFPGSTKSMLILTGDAHSNPLSYYTNELNSLSAHGGKLSIYLSIGATPDNATAQAWRSQGHEIGIHPPSYKPDSYPPFNITSLAQGYDVYSGTDGSGGWFGNTFTSPKSRTVRNHQVAWSGWTDAADIMASHGIAMTTDFYHWGPWLQKSDGSWPHGYITGSGQPMRFARANGTIVPVYQQLTQLVDEQLVTGVGFEGLSSAQSIAVSQQLMDASIAGDYAALMTQFHIDYYGFGDPQTWAEGTLDYATSKGIPIWNADRWLSFTETRHDAEMQNIAWDSVSGKLTYTLAANASGQTLSTLLPPTFNGRALTSVTVDGVATPTTTFTVAGKAQALVSVSAGTHSFVATYGTGGPTATPTNTPVPPTATPTNTPVPPTATPTNTPVGTPTNTPVGTPTNTPVPPTATPTNTPVPPTDTPTNTPIPPTNTPTNTPTSTPTTVPTNTPTSTPIPATATPTATPQPGVKTVTYTTAAAFSSCTNSGTLVTRVGNGEVRLAGTLGEEYTTSTLSPSNWRSGTWAGGSYTPTISTGMLRLAGAGGAYVRSASSRAVTTLEFSAQFTAAPWEHIGWGSLDFEGDRYLLFSTLNGTTNLYARSNNSGAEQRTDLGPIPSGVHTYRIERAAQSATVDTIRYFIDGVQVAQHSVATVPQLYIYQSHNGGTTPTLNIDRIWTYGPYVSSGTFTSCAFDTGGLAVWKSASWSASLPAGTTLTLRTRTSLLGLTWSAWSAPLTTSGATITSPSGRYIQYMLELSTTNSANSPVVDSVTLGFTGGTAPTATTLEVTPSTSEPGTTVYLPLALSSNAGVAVPSTLDLTVRRGEGGMTISWSNGHAARWYRVWRLRGAQSVELVAEFDTLKPNQQLSANVPDDPRISYWVTAERGDGGVVAQSPIER